MLSSIFGGRVEVRGEEDDVLRGQRISGCLLMAWRVLKLVFPVANLGNIGVFWFLNVGNLAFYSKQLPALSNRMYALFFI